MYEAMFEVVLVHNPAHRVTGCYPNDISRTISDSLHFQLWKLFRIGELFRIHNKEPK